MNLIMFMLFSLLYLTLRVVCIISCLMIIYIFISTFPEAISIVNITRVRIHSWVTIPIYILTVVVLQFLLMLWWIMVTWVNTCHLFIIALLSIALSTTILLFVSCSIYLWVCVINLFCVSGVWVPLRSLCFFRLNITPKERNWAVASRSLYYFFIGLAIEVRIFCYIFIYHLFVQYL